MTKEERNILIYYRGLPAVIRKQVYFLVERFWLAAQNETIKAGEGMK
jgi:hypothetical protein